MHDIRYNPLTDEFVVGNPFAQSVLTFRGGANGEVPPIRMIQGPHSGLIKPDNLEIDPTHNELIVPEPENSTISAFPLNGSGDVAPIRILRGAANGWSAGTAAVDPIHNVLVGAGSVTVNGEERHGLLIFDRTASGDTKPLRVIAGPKSGLRGTRQIHVYAPGGWIVVTHPGRGDGEKPENIFIGVWSIYDNGDVPPRWRIGGPGTTMKNPRGVVVNAAAREVIVADMRLNQVLTYSFPEIFNTSATPPGTH